MDKLKARYEEAFEKVKEELISGKWNNWDIYHTTYWEDFKEKLLDHYFACNDLQITTVPPEVKNAKYDENGKPLIPMHATPETNQILNNLFRMVPNNPYWEVMEKLHPIWVDNNIPLLKKEPEMEKAFRALVHGEESQDQESPGKEPEKTAGEAGEGKIPVDRCKILYDIKKTDDPISFSFPGKKNISMEKSGLKFTVLDMKTFKETIQNNGVYELGPSTQENDYRTKQKRYDSMANKLAAFFKDKGVNLPGGKIYKSDMKGKRNFVVRVEGASIKDTLTKYKTNQDLETAEDHYAEIKSIAISSNLVNGDESLKDFKRVKELMRDIERKFNYPWEEIEAQVNSIEDKCFLKQSEIYKMSS